MIINPKTEMRVLLLSTVLYLAGVAAILFLRPRLMFRDDGTWKEFSLHDIDGTVVPFWLFCIIWAFVTYFFCKLVFPEANVNIGRSAAALSGIATTPLSSLTARLTSGQGDALEEETPSSSGPTAQNLVQPLPTKQEGGARRNKSSAKPKPGFYKFHKDHFVWIGSDDSETEED
jgi:hypothetical protein